MKKLNVTIQLEMTVPDDWALVETSEGTPVIQMADGKFLDIAIEPLFATDPEGEIKSTATFHLYGQENTGEMYATCKSDMLLKGEDPDKIKFGSTLSEYGFDHDLRFNFMLTNPPYGTTWKQDMDNLNVGTDKKPGIVDTRFNLPVKNFKGEKEVTCLTSRSNDGQLMFMLHMIAKMKDPKDGGSRIASVHNGSALFTGDAGSGESGIRQYIIENDLLE